MRRTIVVSAAYGLLAACIPRLGAPPETPPPAPGQQETVQPLPPRDLDDERANRRAASRPVTTAAAPSRPAWEARPASPDAERIDETTYTVRPGDTLFAIADRLDAGVDAIVLANGLEPPFTVRVGQRLRIPGGRYHLIRPGESGIAIARAYGVEWSRIVAANGLTEPYVLRAGQRVLVPGEVEGGSRAAERAAAFRLDIDDILTGGEPALASNEAPAKPTARPTRALPPTAVVAAPARLAGGFVWPVSGPVVKRFGPGQSGERSDGIKIAVPLQTPIHATADGVVAYAGTGIAALGGLVIIKHGSNWASVYGHAGKLLVTRGQAVKRGQVIATSGDSGFADRPEVHFELRKGRSPVDPLGQLPGR